MKKIVFPIFLILPLLTFGQIEKPIKKGNFILGGTGIINYNLIDNRSGSNYSFQTNVFEINLNPNFSYFIIDNLALGLSATAGLEFEKGNNGYAWGAGPQIRYYFNNGIFLKTDYSYLYGHSDYGKTNTSLFKAGPGYAIFLSSSVSIEPAILYERFSDKFTTFDQIVYRQTIPGEIYKQKWSSIVFEIGFNIFL